MTQLTLLQEPGQAAGGGDAGGPTKSSKISRHNPEEGRKDAPGRSSRLDTPVATSHKHLCAHLPRATHAPLLSQPTRMPIRALGVCKPG